MTPIEERLKKALGEEADARSVDVLRMRRELDDRLDRPSSRPARSRILPSVAAAVLLVGGTIVGIQALRDDDTTTDTASPGKVDGSFSCPETASVDLSGNQDEFVPDLNGRTPAKVAREYDAPRWDFVEDGDTARLRLGNADGTLGSETSYARRNGEWQMVSSVACSNGTPAAPTAEPLRLGTHGSEPWPATGALASGNPKEGEAVLVDDRPVYDYSGLITRHRSFYLAQCGRAFCFAVGDPQSSVTGRLPISPVRDPGYFGTICEFFVPDDLVGRGSPYTVLAAWDSAGHATRFTVTGPDGDYQAKSFHDESWGSQQVWLALVPTPPVGVKLLAEFYDETGVVYAHNDIVRCD